jgi:hypothetical protein
MQIGDRNRSAVVLSVMLVIGGLTAFATRQGISNVNVVFAIAAALAAIWGLGSVALGRLVGRPALLFTPALAAYVLSVVAVTFTLNGHRQFLIFALVNLVLSVWLIRLALKRDWHPRA